MFPDEAYTTVARELGYDNLGVAGDLDVAEMRNDIGTLGQKRWECLAWEKPSDETLPLGTGSLYDPSKMGWQIDYIRF